jgi:hypothetical protein
MMHKDNADLVVHTNLCEHTCIRRGVVGYASAQFR